jgi:hypothetical protein
MDMSDMDLNMVTKTIGIGDKQWAAHTLSSSSFGCDKGKAHWEAFIFFLSLFILIFFSRRCITTTLLAWLEKGNLLVLFSISPA